MNNSFGTNLDALEAPVAPEPRRISIFEGERLKPTARVASFYGLLQHLDRTRTNRFPVDGLIIATKFAAESSFYWESDLLTHFPDEKIRRNLFSLEAARRIVIFETTFPDVTVQSLTFTV